MPAASFSSAMNFCPEICQEPFQHWSHMAINFSFVVLLSLKTHFPNTSKVLLTESFIFYIFKSLN